MAGLRIQDYNPLSLPSGRKVTVYLDGRPIEALEGESVAASLHAAGIKVISRSLKYHRPRGLYCLNGRCGQCMARVDGVPNVRICNVNARDGLRIGHQNGIPSVEHDVLCVLDRLGSMFSAGFQYKKFFRPRFLVPVYQAIIRRLAGYGDPPEANIPALRTNLAEAECEVAVIGGGPAGLSAAKASAEAGASTILIDDEKSLGGHLRFETSTPYVRQVRLARTPAFTVARELAREVESTPLVRRVVGMTIGLYGKNLAVANGAGITLVRAKTIVVATGAYERRPLFNGNDLPGIFGYRGMMSLLNLYRVRPGRRVVMYAADNSALATVLRVFRQTGISLEAYVTLAEGPQDLREEIQVFDHSKVRSAFGRNSVSAVEIASLDGSRMDRVKCDLLCLAGFLQPTYEIQCQAGCDMRMREDLGGYVAAHGGSMETSVPGIFVAGEAAGIRDEDAYLSQGRLVGLSAAFRAGRAGMDISLEMDGLKQDSPARIAEPCGEPLTRSFVCFCEDTTMPEIDASMGDGFNDPESLKRYTGTTMGVCQGKYCLLNMILAIQERTGKTGWRFTTQRPPIMPVSLGALAAKRDGG